MVYLLAGLFWIFFFVIGPILMMSIFYFGIFCIIKWIESRIRQSEFQWNLYKTIIWISYLCIILWMFLQARYETFITNILLAGVFLVFIGATRIQAQREFMPKFDYTLIVICWLLFIFSYLQTVWPQLYLSTAELHQRSMKQEQSK